MKIGIIGIGRVGATLAYTLVMQRICIELVLVNRRREIAEAEAADLSHAAALGGRPMVVRAGETADLSGATVVVVCASVPVDPVKIATRRDLAAANARLFADLLPEVARCCPDTILLVASNPVDALTTLAVQQTGFPSTRVLGTGTLIDSARYRDLVAQDTGIHPADIRAYILGEHGETQFPALSIAMVGGERANDPERQAELFRRAEASAHEVFKRKGYTNYAIARAAGLIVESITGDYCRTFPVSVMIDGFAGVSDVCISLPCVLGATGVKRILHPALNEDEREKFRASAEAVRATLAVCS